MTTASTLTDRYVAEAVRSLTRGQRKDIEAELRASIADAIEDRLEAGTDAAAAERDVLAELGPPRSLAASYSDKPSHLIGPDLFRDYVRVLTVLLSTAVPLWFVFSGVVTFVAGASPLDSLGSALWGSFETAMSLAFIVTLVFAIIERTPALRGRRATKWDLHSLPAVPDQRGYVSELVGGVLFLVVIASVVIVLQSVGAVEGPNGTLIGPLDAPLWESGVFWVALFYSAVSISFHVFAHYTGWSVANAVATIVLDVLFVVPAVWIVAGDRLLNPDYFAAIGWPDGVQIVGLIALAVVVLFPLLDTVDAIIRTVRTRRVHRSPSEAA